MKFNTKQKTLREAEEFQPDAIMLEAQRPPFPMHVVWFLVVALLFLMIVWASLAKVDKIVAADGSKVGKTYCFTSALLNAVDILVTDSSADPAELEKIRSCGVRILIAGENS